MAATVIVRACVDCGRPTESQRDNRCPRHKQVHLAMRATQARISYRRYRSNRVIVIANATACAICTKPFDDPADPPEADHITPRSKGGLNTLANLRAVHRSCNLARSDRP
jgi:5-methylcytosine-specific restriction endonuclease McrA